MTLIGSIMDKVMQAGTIQSVCQRQTDYSVQGV